MTENYCPQLNFQQAMPSSILKVYDQIIRSDAEVYNSLDVFVTDKNGDFLWILLQSLYNDIFNKNTNIAIRAATKNYHNLTSVLLHKISITKGAMPMTGYSLLSCQYTLTD